MIHAKDLMIGNYLNTSFGVAKIISIDNVGITFKNKDGEFDIDFHDEDAWIQEIPLTTEILEKNFPEPTDGLTWFPEEGGFNCHSYVPKCEINAFGLFRYVHQLQNALRLCGIEKTIEL